MNEQWCVVVDHNVAYKIPESASDEPERLPDGFWKQTVFFVVRQKQYVRSVQTQKITNY